MKINCHVFQPLKQGLFLGEVVVDSLSLQSRKGVGKERAVRHTREGLQQNEQLYFHGCQGCVGNRAPTGGRSQTTVWSLLSGGCSSHFNPAA